MFLSNILHSIVLKLAYIASVASTTNVSSIPCYFQAWGKFLSKQCSSVAHETFAKNLYNLSVYKLLRWKIYFIKLQINILWVQHWIIVYVILKETCQNARLWANRILPTPSNVLQYPHLNIFLPSDVLPFRITDKIFVFNPNAYKNWFWSPLRWNMDI